MRAANLARDRGTIVRPPAPATTPPPPSWDRGRKVDPPPAPDPEAVKLFLAGL